MINYLIGKGKTIMLRKCYGGVEFACPARFPPWLPPFPVFLPAAGARAPFSPFCL
jgi:hypothetical protein